MTGSAVDGMRILALQHSLLCAAGLIEVMTINISVVISVAITQM